MAGHITSIQRKYIRKRTKEVDLDPSEMVGELNIIPYLDIVVNLIMFLLATTEAVLLIAQIETDLPKIARGGSKKGAEVSTPLNLNVTVTAKGVIVSGSGGKLAPGCQGTEPGGAPTVPIKGNKYNWEALTKCVWQVKQVPQFQDEDSVTISADPQVMYEHVVAAMDAVRSKGKEELFPRVLISVGVR
jgi:biopolymer transport protein ExbD